MSVRRFDELDRAPEVFAAHLQDAMPIRLGQEFTAFGHTIARHAGQLARAADPLRDLGIGGSAVGTAVTRAVAVRPS